MKIGMGLLNLAKEQEREGSHILDVNVDFVGRDGVADMKELVSRLVTNVKIPLMLDSTEWEKMEAGLEYAGGKCILNSTNYEDGDDHDISKSFRPLQRIRSGSGNRFNRRRRNGSNSGR